CTKAAELNCLLKGETLSTCSLTVRARAIRLAGGAPLMPFCAWVEKEKSAASPTPTGLANGFRDGSRPSAEYPAIAILRLEKSWSAPKRSATASVMVRVALALLPVSERSAATR